MLQIRCSILQITKKIILWKFATFYYKQPLDLRAMQEFFKLAPLTLELIAEVLNQLLEER